MLVFAFSGPVAGAEDAPFTVVSDAVFCASIVEQGVIPESMYPTHEEYMVVFAAEQVVEDHSDHGDHD